MNLQVASEVQKHIAEGGLYWEHSLGVSVLSGHKRLFNFGIIWIDIGVKHKVPHLAWPYLDDSFSVSYRRVHYLLGYDSSSCSGT